MRADFDRVYSAPEPPPRRRFRRSRALAAVLAFAVAAAGAVFLVLPLFGGDDGGPEAGPTVTAERSSPEEPSASPEGDVVRTLPRICGTVAESTFLRLVPEGRPETYNGPRAGFCGYNTPSGTSLRYVRLETRLGEISGDLDPLSWAKWSFDQDFKRARDDTSARTLVLAQLPGLGEQAFHWFTVNKGESTVTARVEARIRNVIVTVTYDRAFTGDPEKHRATGLDEAAKVAREALASYE